MKKIWKFFLSFLLTLIVVLGLISFGYSWLKSDNPDAAHIVDDIVATVVPQSAPGQSNPDVAATLKPGAEYLTEDDFTDKKAGAAYLAWKKTFKDPLAALTKNTSITADTIAALAGGGAGALSAGSSISTDDLSQLGYNARAYKEAIDKAAADKSLPKDTQDQMKKAQSQASELASLAERAAELGIKAKRGDLSAAASLSSLMGDIQKVSGELDKSVSQAERTLGVKAR